MLIVLCVLIGQTPAPTPAIPPGLERVAAVFRQEGTTVTATATGFVATQGATTVTVTGSIDCPVATPANITATDLQKSQWMDFNLRAVHNTQGETVLAGQQSQMDMNCAQMFASVGFQKKLETFRDQAWSPQTVAPRLIKVLGAAMRDHGQVGELSAEDRERWQVTEPDAFVLFIGDRRLLVTGTVTCVAPKQTAPGRMETFDLQVKATVRDKEKRTILGTNFKSLTMMGATCSDAYGNNAEKVGKAMKELAKSLVR